MPTTVMQNVKWSVNDVPGGDAEIGTIDSNGMYRAPEKAPMPHEIHICAVANGAPNRYLWATSASSHGNLGADSRSHLCSFLPVVSRIVKDNVAQAPADNFNAVQTSRSKADLLRQAQHIV